MQVKNTCPYPVTNYQMYILTINSGFFETIRGSSRQIRGILSEQDIIQAEVAPMGTVSSLSRIVGGGIFGSLGNVLSKAKDIYNATKPAVSAIKGLLPESGMAGHAKNALSAVGYGTGAGSSGGRARKGLDSRLI